LIEIRSTRTYTETKFRGNSYESGWIPGHEIYMLLLALIDSNS